MRYLLSVQKIVKRTVDLSVCALLGLILIPVFILIAIAIKLDSPGPVIFKQMRIGRNQRRFVCYKFRSMFDDNKEAIHQEFIGQLMTQENEQKNLSIRAYEAQNEKRITRLGRILRKFKLDELPQIFNVIKGDMSLVGPRPAIDYEIKYHDENMLRRFNVPSGITGYWQVHSGHGVDYRRMVALDLYYVDHWSLLLDLKIILMTIPALLKMAQSR